MNMRIPLLSSVMIAAVVQCSGLAQGLRHPQDGVSLIQGSVAQSAAVRGERAGVMGELAPFGVQCSAGTNKSVKAQVISVAPYSVAYWKGLKSGDSIISISPKDQGYLVFIQRGAQRYAAELGQGRSSNSRPPVNNRVRLRISRRQEAMD